MPILIDERGDGSEYFRKNTHTTVRDDYYEAMYWSRTNSFDPMDRSIDSYEYTATIDMINDHFDNNGQYISKLYDDIISWIRDNTDIDYVVMWKTLLSNTRIGFKNDEDLLLFDLYWNRVIR